MTLVQDQLQTMVAQECAAYRTVDYLALGYQQSLIQRGSDDPQILIDLSEESSTSTGGSSTGGISEAWREKICEWAYQVIDHFDFSREVVAISMHYLDRYLTKRVVNKRVFQLAAMAALLLAVKLNEPTKLSMSSMIELSRGYFTVEQLEAMEKSLMRELGWQLHPPTTYSFTKQILCMLPFHNVSPGVRHDILELSRFLNELSVIDYFFVPQQPSHVAVASIANAIEDLSSSISEETQRSFVDLVSTLGFDLATPSIVLCRSRLRLVYSQGGYANNVTTEERPEETPSPVCVSQGTTVYQDAVPNQESYEDRTCLHHKSKAHS